VSYHSSTASFLATLSRDEASCEEAQLTVETGGWPPPLEASVEAPSPDVPAPHRRLPLASLPARPFSVRAEALCEALPCLRRFQLAEVFPPPSLFTPTDAEVRKRLAGAGLWGARFAAERPPVHLRESYVLAVERPGVGPILVHGTADARVSWANGSEDLLRFCRGSEQGAQEWLYAAILTHGARAIGIDGPLRAGTLTSVPAPSVEDDPRWAPPRDLAAACEAIIDLVERLLTLDHAHLAPRVPEPECLASACPHVTSCYAQPVARTAPAAARQTAFEFFDNEGGGDRARGRKRRR